MHRKHLHERGVGVDLVVRHHQGQDHRDLDGKKKRLSTNTEIDGEEMVSVNRGVYSTFTSDLEKKKDFKNVSFVK